VVEIKDIIEKIELKKLIIAGKRNELDDLLRELESFVNDLDTSIESLDDAQNSLQSAIDDLSKEF